MKNYLTEFIGPFFLLLTMGVFRGRNDSHRVVGELDAGGVGDRLLRLLRHGDSSLGGLDRSWLTLVQAQRYEPYWIPRILMSKLNASPASG